ncbi:hypothetical protein CVS40_12852 [Lucilia cuprina]|nr:hypothetical protein CVS40_12852 [Lucilia cuprina]
MVFLNNNNLGPIANDNSILISNFDSSNLNIAHLNAQSIIPIGNPAKMDEIRNIFRNSNVDVVGVSETWLRESVPDGAILIDGYRVYRNDRVVRRGGGVCLYVKNTLKSRTVHEERNETVVEGIFIEVTVNDTEKILVGVMYLPHGGLQFCEDIIGDLSSTYDNIVIMGDFNVDLFRNCERARNFWSNFELSLIHNNLPTHFVVGKDETTLID